MTITEYKAKFNQNYYDLVELVLHVCGICGEYLLLDSDYVAQHLRSNNLHNMTHANYNAQYMTLMMKVKPKEPVTAAKPPNTSEEKHSRVKKFKAKRKKLDDNEKENNSKIDNLNDHLDDMLTEFQNFNDSKKSKNDEEKNDSKVDLNNLNDLVTELQNLNEPKKLNNISQVGQTFVPLDIPPLPPKNFVAEEFSSIETQEHVNQDISVENFRKFLDSISEDGESLRYPVLEMLLTLNI